MDRTAPCDWTNVRMRNRGAIGTLVSQRCPGPSRLQRRCPTAVLRRLEGDDLIAVDGQLADAGVTLVFVEELDLRGLDLVWLRRGHVRSRCRRRCACARPRRGGLTYALCLPAPTSTWRRRRRAQTHLVTGVLGPRTSVRALAMRPIASRASVSTSRMPAILVTGACPPRIERALMSRQTPLAPPTVQLPSGTVSLRVTERFSATGASVPPSRRRASAACAVPRWVNHGAGVGCLLSMSAFLS